MTKIIGLGNALVDVLVQIGDNKLLDQLQLPKGGMMLVDDAQYKRIGTMLTDVETSRATGGSAANTILALSAVYDGTAFVGAVGADAYGSFFREAQLSRGIDSRLVACEDKHTGVATTFISPDGERTFATHLGASAMIDPQAIPYRKGDVLHIEGYMVQDHQLMEQVLHKAADEGMTISYDLASWNIVQGDRDFIQRMVREYVNIVFANEEEAAAYCQTSDMEAAAEQLAADADIAVVKLGKRGALVRRQADGQSVFVPTATQDKVVDTTAAGDFFAAGFLYGYVTGQSLATCLAYGHRTAGEVIQVLGTQVTPERLRAAIEAAKPQ